MRGCSSPIRGCSTCARSGGARCALRSARPCAPTRRPPPARPPAARPASAWRAPATVRINRLYRLYAPRNVDTHGTRHNRLQGRARASASLSSSSSRGRLLSSFTTSSPLQTCRGRGEALGVLWLPAKRGGWGACAVCGRVEGWDQGGGGGPCPCPRRGKGSGGGPHAPQEVRLSRSAIYCGAGRPALCRWDCRSTECSSPHTARAYASRRTPSSRTRAGTRRTRPLRVCWRQAAY